MCYVDTTSGFLSQGKVCVMNKRSSDSKVILSAHKIGKTYGKHPALVDLSLEVRAGEIIGLLGPNGAGKTTAIRILTTILPATQGHFTIGGIPDSRPAEVRALIGVVPESNGFPRSMTGVEYLTYMGRLYGQSSHHARAHAVQLLQMVGLAKASEAQVHTYSQGMRRRLSIARALVNSPKILFLDEPTLGIDPIGHREILQIIHQAAEVHRAAVILSSHLLEVTERICSRILILNRGHVIAEGEVSAIKRQVSVARMCRIRVPADALMAAQTALAAMDNVEVRVNSNLQHELLVSGTAQHGEVDTRAVLQRLLQAGVMIDAYENDTISLSDAFLKMIEEGQVQ